MTTPDIAVLVGSLRAASINRKLADALRELAPQGCRFTAVDLDLPLYNPDLDEDGRRPAGWTTLRESIVPCDALLFVTPEYNRSVPAALKNALDIGSRPMGANVWQGKPGAVVSASPGAIGGFGANHHLRQSLMCLDVLCLAQPEAYIGGAHKLFADDGSIAVPETRAFLEGFMARFAAWIETCRKHAQ